MNLSDEQAKVLESVLNLEAQDLERILAENEVSTENRDAYALRLEHVKAILEKRQQVSPYPVEPR